MFDQHINKYGPESVEVRVTEQRAPTDASLALLKQMQDEARASILSAVRLDHNNFKGVIHKRDDYPSDERVFAVMFELNGKRLTVEHRVSLGEQDKTKIAVGLRDKVAEEIATQLLSEVFR